MTPLVSVVLPTHNGSRWLDAALASWAAQSYVAWELIVVDDGSRDQSPALTEAWAARDPRIRLVRHERQRGLPAGLNTGIAVADGLLLTWTSDDNLAQPGMLAALVDHLARRPEIDVVYSDYSRIDENGSVIGRVVVDPPEMLHRRNVVGASFLYRARLHAALGGYADNFRLAEDYEFWLRVATRFRLDALHVDAYRYREHGGSLTRRQATRIGAIRDAALAHHVRALPWLDRRGRTDALLELAVRAMRRRDIAAAARHLVGATRQAPGRVVRWLGRPARVLTVLRQALR